MSSLDRVATIRSLLYLCRVASADPPRHHRSISISEHRDHIHGILLEVCKASNAHPYGSSPLLISRQRQEDILQLRKVRCSQSSDRVPASRGIEGNWLATSLVETCGDVVEGFGVGVEGGMDPADCRLAVLDAGFVDLSCN